MHAGADEHLNSILVSQTGSGKTYTMEGFKYVGGAHAPSVRVSSSTGPQPHADFDATPEAELGIVPRAVSALFAALRRDASTGSKRTTVRVSFVQLYKEQVSEDQHAGSSSAFMVAAVRCPCSMTMQYHDLQHGLLSPLVTGV
jgi:hypothetical protein